MHAVAPFSSNSMHSHLRHSLLYVREEFCIIRNLVNGTHCGVSAFRSVKSNWIELRLECPSACTASDLWVEAVGKWDVNRGCQRCYCICGDATSQWGERLLTQSPRKIASCRYISLNGGTQWALSAFIGGGVSLGSTLLWAVSVMPVYWDHEMKYGLTIFIVDLLITREICR